jgi:hypothetical protein
VLGEVSAKLLDPPDTCPAQTIRPVPPPPTATTLTDVTPNGTIQEYDPAVEYVTSPGAAVVVVDRLELYELLPYALVAYIDMVYLVNAVNPNINMVPVDAVDTLMLVVPVVATAV